MTTKLYLNISSKKKFNSLILIIIITLTGTLSSFAQSNEAADRPQEIKPLRSDVGIIGLTANFKWLGDFKYKGDDELQSDTNTELEIEIRDVRTISPRAAVGFQILTSFFAGDSDFGVGSWGLGPVVRGYPLKSDQWQPYVQADALFGNNLAAGELSDTRTGGDGFRVRLGLRGGLAYRINNNLGLFLEAGPDWESSRFFRSDTRVLQVNFGIDLYRFN